MVVSEAKIVFGLGDVVRVRFRCQHCGNETVIRLGNDNRPIITQRCPLCNAEWLSRHRAERINDMLKDMVAPAPEKVDVLIEIDAPEN